MSTDDAAALIRQQKRYKNFKNKSKRVPIKQLVAKAQQNTSDIQDVEGGLSCITVASSHAYNFVADSEIQQEDFICAAIEQRDVAQDQEPPEATPLTSSTEVADDSSWPTATLTFNNIDRFLREAPASELPEPIRETLRKYRRAFPDELPDGLPPRRPYDHRILLVPGKLPSRSPIYSASPEHYKFLKEEISKLLRKGWIGHTRSPFAAPAVMVDKHSDDPAVKKMRMVINYKCLNDLTIAPDYPTPTVQAILEMLGNANFFTTLDLESGFHQIRMNRADRWKTAFRCIFGAYEFHVMPFELKGAPATFQSTIHVYLEPVLGIGVIAHLDDVLIFTVTLEKHVKLLSKVLAIFEAHQFYPKLAKCRFAQRELDYLGYRISAEGIQPAPDKVQAIAQWPEVLVNDTQVRQFMGVTNVVRPFAGPDFARLAMPLVCLTKKGVPFQWTDQHTAAVRAIKDRIIRFVTLKRPDMSKPFILYTDASGYAIGAVLLQEDGPLGFLSAPMSAVQQRYPIYDQELLALMMALAKWKHLLRVARVDAFTDHKALTYLQTLKNDRPLRGRTARWLELLAEFNDLTVHYVEGKHNLAADAMSRHPIYSPPPPTQ